MNKTFCNSQFSNLFAILGALAGAAVPGLDPSLAGAAPAISVSGGITPGFADHTFPDPQLLFT